MPTNIPFVTYTYSNIIITHTDSRSPILHTDIKTSLWFQEVGQEKAKETVRMNDEQFPSFNRFVTIFQRKGPLIVFPNYIM